MKMNQSPMMYLAMCCTECGQPIERPVEAAGEFEIAVAVTAATGTTFDEQGLVQTLCPKCQKCCLMCLRRPGTTA